MSSLVVQVKTRMSIHSHRKVLQLLDGEYASMFQGRSMDFEDLREYVAGDDVKDIDWKATARSMYPLVKRYVAERKQSVLIVADTGAAMAADANLKDSKRDLAVMAAGAMGYIASRHGDLVGLVAGDSHSTSYLPLKGSLAHLEMLLQHMKQRIRLDGHKSDLAAQLDYIARNVRRRTMLVVISDDSELSPTAQRLIKRLRVQHEIMWIAIADADPTSASAQTRVLEVETGATLPDFLIDDRRFAQELQHQQLARWINTTNILQRHGIVSERIDADDDVLPSLFSLLKRQRGSHASAAR